MRGKWLSYLPMVLAVCVVAAAAGYLVTHPPGATPPAPTGVPGPPPAPAPSPAPSPPQGAPPAPPAPAPEPAPAPAPEQPPPPPAAGPSTQPPASPTPTAPTHAPSPSRAPRAPSAQVFHVQAGAFARLENAEALVKELRAKHYSASIIRGRLYRVWIGQPLDRSGAEQLAQRLRGDGFEAALIPSQ